MLKLIQNIWKKIKKQYFILYTTVSKDWSLNW